MMECLIFNDKNRGYWIKRVNSIICALISNETGEIQEIELHIQHPIKRNDFTPFHIVLLSCLSEYIERLGYVVAFEADDKELTDFIFKDH